MGLDTSHDCWHGSYSGFKHWRNAVAVAAGIELVPTRLGPNYKIDWDKYEAMGPDTIHGHWDKDPDDALMVLLHHSDCEGVIAHRFCEPLAKRLKELLPKMDEHNREVAERFIEGLMFAHEEGEDVDFH